MKIQAALQCFDDLLQDPVQLKKFKEEFELQMVANDNRLICSVMDPIYRQVTTGDMIAYGMDPEYYDKLQCEALDLFYQNHGHGD